MFMFLFLFLLYAVTMLIFPIKRVVSSEKWCNYVVTFFLKMPKTWVGRTTANGEKKKDGLSDVSQLLLMEPKHGRHSRERPATTFIDQLESDIGLSRQDLPSVMANRREWGTHGETFSREAHSSQPRQI